jgi:hypothetical protein
MGPLVLGLGGAALWLVLRKKTPALPGQVAPALSSNGAPTASPQALVTGSQMLFRDYQWTVLISSLTDVSRFLSPPPGATIGSGKWWRYPGGYATGPFGPLRGGQLAPVGAPPAAGHLAPAGAHPLAPRPKAVPPAAHSTVGSSYAVAPTETGPLARNPRKIVQVPDWGGVPISSVLYAWRPNTGTSQALNGYLVYGTADWYVGLDDTAMSEDSDKLVHGAGQGMGGFHLYVQGVPPAPTPTPGTPAAAVVANAGKGAAWVLKHPGLLVWIGASNANEADLQALSAPVVLSSAPAVPQVPAAGAQP